MRRTPLLLPLLGALACAPDPSPQSLLLIVSDTLRAGVLDCYGGRARTPHICSLAERGVLFENAYSNASWTLPSSVALFTGNHPSEYARDAKTADKKDARSFFYVDEHETLLAEALAARGYVTRSFVENAVVEQPNVLQGFVQWKPSDGAPAASAAIEQLGIDTSDERYAQLLPALDFVLGAGDSPFFVLQWFLDPHAVYDPPARFLADLDVGEAELPRPLEFYTHLGSKDRPEEGIRDLKKVGKRLSREEVRLLLELYRREVESVDERVGHLLRALELTGRRESTFVVFTSDHGESFGEHGPFMHGHSFYDELVAVPLLIAGPGVPAGIRVPDVVSLVDLMPTLRDLLGVDGLRSDLRGRTLVALLSGEEEEATRSSYLVNQSLQHRGDALVEGRHKLIAPPAGKRELYDLDRDRREQHSLTEKRPEVAARMWSTIRTLRRENAQRRRAKQQLADPETLRRAADETLEQLRALGYVE